MAGKEEDAAEDAVRNLEDEVEKLKQDLAAAEKRALASFIAMQHLRRELDILEGKEGTVAPAENVTDGEAQVLTVRRFYSDCFKRIRAVPAQMVKCAGCGSVFSCARAFVYTVHDRPEAVYCKRNCILEHAWASRPEVRRVGVVVDTTTSVLRRIFRKSTNIVTRKVKFRDDKNGWQGRRGRA
jgi:hypothetical protein